MNIELVKAKEKDKSFLLHLRKLTMVNHLHKSGIYLSDEEHVSRVDKHFEGAQIILESSNRVGLLKCKETESNIEILQLQILPRFQGKGIGKQVLHKIITKAESANKNTFLKVLKENPAIHLYKRAGFKIIDEDQYEFYMQKRI